MRENERSVFSAGHRNATWHPNASILSASSFLTTTVCFAIGPPCAWRSYVIQYDMMTETMSRPKPSRSLKDLHSEQTRRLILASALELLEKRSVVETTARSVARHAGIAERTVFRHFANREDFLDAVALAVVEKQAAPEPPRTREELLGFPRRLFARFEATAGLTRSALRSD